MPPRLQLALRPRQSGCPSLDALRTDGAILRRIEQKAGDAAQRLEPAQRSVQPRSSQQPLKRAPVAELSVPHVVANHTTRKGARAHREGDQRPGCLQGCIAKVSSIGAPRVSIFSVPPARGSGSWEGRGDQSQRRQALGIVCCPESGDHTSRRMADQRHALRSGQRLDHGLQVGHVEVAVVVQHRLVGAAKAAEVWRQDAELLAERPAQALPVASRSAEPVNCNHHASATAIPPDCEVPPGPADVDSTATPGARRRTTIHADDRFPRLPESR